MDTGPARPTIDQPLQQTLEVGQLDEEVLAAEGAHAGRLTTYFLLLHTPDIDISWPGADG